MDVGGFASCDVCREYRWISDGGQGLCVECHQRATAARPDPPPPEPRAPAEPQRQPETRPESHRSAKDVRKRVARRYEKGKLGNKPSRATLAEFARVLWDDLSPSARERFVEELRALGFSSAEPFEAMIDFCQVTVLKNRAALKEKKKPAKKS